MIRAFERSYFGGETMLFKDTTETLKWHVTQGDMFIDRLEDLLDDVEFMHKKPEMAAAVGTIKPKEVESIAKACAQVRGRILLDMARVEASKAMGLEAALEEVYRRHFGTDAK